MVDCLYLGRSLLTPLKGTKLHWFWSPCFVSGCFCSATNATLKSCLSLNHSFLTAPGLPSSVILLSAHTANELVFTQDICVHCVGMFTLYLFPGCFCLQHFCWCLHIAAPKRGRLFHLTEGQYLHEHSYQQLCKLGWDRTQPTVSFNKSWVPVICSASASHHTWLFVMWRYSGGGGGVGAFLVL